MSQLSIFLLGPPRIKYDGHEVEFDTRKAVALLTYLGITKQRQSRSVLASILWPNSNHSRSLANLRRTLSSLNAQLRTWLDIDRYAVGLKFDSAIWTDVIEFRNLIAQFKQSETTLDSEKFFSPLVDAVALYRSEFMAGFTLRDSLDFDEWQFYERTELQKDINFALEQLVQSYTARQEHEQAIAYARQWLEVDRSQEAVHYCLMQLYTTVGQRSAALRQYEECKIILHNEFGEDPHPTTSALYDEIKHERPISVPTPMSLPFGQGDSQINSIPQYLTPIIGRDREVSKAVELLQSPNCRLLNVVGIGGSGKTRLAVEVAHQLSSNFEHGATFIELDVENSADLVLNTIAKAIGLTFYSGGNFKQQIYDFLREKVMLIVIDSLDQLDEQQIINDILAAAPDVKFISTGHHRLGFYQEHVLELGGLQYPDLPSDISKIDYPAIQMFEQCAQRHAPFFEAKDHLMSIIKICRLTGGLPLALELAASWIRVLSCDSIAEEIEQSLGFLEADIKNLPTRHKTVHAILEISWTLLSPQQQHDLLSLSIFRNGFERAAASRIAGISLQTLANLRDRAFLTRIGSDRYRIPELLRRYVAEHNEQQYVEDKLVISSRHGEYYSGLLHHWEPQLTTSLQSKALQIIIEELDNIRLAWSWSLSAQRWDILAHMIEGLYRFYDTTLLHDEGMNVFQDALGKIGLDEDYPQRSKLMVRLLIRYGWFCCWRNRMSEAQNAIERAHQIATHTGEVQETALALNHLGILCLFMGQFEDTIAHLQDSIDIYEELHDGWGAARALSNRSVALRKLGRNTEAKDNLRRSLALYRKAGDQLGIGHVYNNLGNVYYGEENFEDAQQYYEQSIALKREIYQDFNWGIACTQINLGKIAQLHAHYQKADHILTECLQTFKQIGHQGRIIECLRYLGSIAHQLNNLLSACEYYQESLNRVQHLNQAPTILAVLGDVADYLATLARSETAATILNLIIVRADADNETIDKAKSTLANLQITSSHQDSRGVDPSLQKLIKSLEFAAKETLTSLL